MHLLFICSRNKWRSRTAETIFKSLPGHQVQSAGTSNSAVVRLNGRQLALADIVFVMEKKHREIISEHFPAFDTSAIVVLHIPDAYQYMDEELIDLLQAGITPYLNEAL